MTTDCILVNRASILTIGAAVIDGRLGFDHTAALSLGIALASLNAQANGIPISSPFVFKYFLH